MNELKTFYRNFPSIKYKRNETIINQDVTPAYVYAIKSGVVESYNLTANGEHRSISFSVTDDIFPFGWAFSLTDKTLFYYRAYTDCELYKIDKKSFENRLATDPEFNRQIQHRQLVAYNSAQLQVDALGKSYGYAKIAYIFRFFSIYYGKSVGENLVKIQIPLTQQEIADTCGITRETASLDINKLKIQGVVALSDHKYYVVNTKKLNEAINDDYGAGNSRGMM